MKYSRHMLKSTPARENTKCDPAAVAELGRDASPFSVVKRFFCLNRDVDPDFEPPLRLFDWDCFCACVGPLLAPPFAIHDKISIKCLTISNTSLPRRSVRKKCIPTLEELPLCLLAMSA